MCDLKCDEIEPADLEKTFIKHNLQKPEIKTSELYKTINLPKRFECSYLFTGYGYQKENQHPLYRTVNSEYGYYAPNPHTVPTRYFPRSQRFSNEYIKFGMFTDYSLNRL